MPLVAGRVGLMFGLLAALVFAPALRDFVARARTRWLSLAVAASILVTFPIRVAVADTRSWRAIAAWLIG
jgi:hypothetical protein